MNTVEASCNICGGTEFKNSGRRVAVRCVKCGSKERTRLLKMHMDRLGLPRPGSRMLHLAPELGLYNLYSAMLGDGYEAVDYVPEAYRGMNVGRIDLVSDAESLPSESYDIIMHSHVVEHIPGNITAVLFHLHRALKPGGFHAMCVPLLRDSYSEHLGKMTAEEAVKHFGQFDHVRRFSAVDLELTLGMVFRLPDLDAFDLADMFGEDALTRHRIPEGTWRGRRYNNIFIIGKDDLKLKI
jgi:phosphoglycolate phosphatase